MWGLLLGSACRRKKTTVAARNALKSEIIRAVFGREREPLKREVKVKKIGSNKNGAVRSMRARPWPLGFRGETPPYIGIKRGLKNA